MGRTNPAHQHADAERDVALDPAPDVAVEPVPAQSGGSGSFSGGPNDDDDPWRRRDRGDGDDRRSLMMALAILAIGAGVMSARLLARASARKG